MGDLLCRTVCAACREAPPRHAAYRPKNDGIPVACSKSNARIFSCSLGAMSSRRTSRGPVRASATELRPPDTSSTSSPSSVVTVVRAGRVSVGVACGFAVCSSFLAVACAAWAFAPNEEPLWRERPISEKWCELIEA